MNASNLFMPVTGRAVGNGLDKIREKKSKEEERILSGKEEGGLSDVSGGRFPTGRFLAVDFRDGCRRRKIIFQIPKKIYAEAI